MTTPPLDISQLPPEEARKLVIEQAPENLKALIPLMFNIMDLLQLTPEMQMNVTRSAIEGKIDKEFILQLMLAKILGAPTPSVLAETGTANFLGPNCMGEPSYTIDDGEFEDPPGADILAHYTAFAEFVRCDYYPKPAIAPTIDEQLNAWDQCSLVFLILLCTAIGCIFLVHFLLICFKWATKYTGVLDRVTDPEGEAATQAAMWNETCLNTFTPDYVWYTNFKPQGFEFDMEVHREYQKMEEILYKLSHA